MRTLKFLGLSSIVSVAAIASACADNTACSISPAETRPTVENLIGTSVSSDVIDGFLRERMASRQIPGLSVAIINNGEVVYHRSLGVENAVSQTPVTPCSTFQGASITKPLFGYFAMTFVDEGVLDLDRPLAEYLEYPALDHDPRYKAITARMVLSHQTGLPNWRSDNPDGNLRIAFAPGTGFSYSGEAYQYLARVLKSLADVDDAGLEDLFQSRVAEPLGLRHTEIVPSDDLLQRRVDPHWEGEHRPYSSSASYKTFGAAYGVHTEAADFSNWLIGLMDQKGLSASAFESYFAGQGTPVPEQDALSIVTGQDYALGFLAIDTALGRLYGHDGNNPGFSSAIVLDREKRWGFVLLSNGNQTSDLGVELTLFLNTPSQ